MLEIFFLNVGDGDAVLLREKREGRPDYTALVDAGRPFLEPAWNSLRKEAIQYLKVLGVDHLDRMYLTHLHLDHIGGAERILRAVKTDRLSALYFPPDGASWIPESWASADKTQNGIRYMLDMFLDLTKTAEAVGTVPETVQAGKTVLTDRLSVTAILPRPEIINRQKRAFDALYRGEESDPDETYKAAKERNVSSLLFLFTYAGRKILVTGDRYAADWEDERIGPVDVLKVPHHGDPKSMTGRLLKNLRPAVAVISCQNDPNSKKDRPNDRIVRLLQRRVPQVFCTENKPLPTLEASTHNGIRVAIEDDGAMRAELI